MKQSLFVLFPLAGVLIVGCDSKATIAPKSSETVAKAEAPSEPSEPTSIAAGGEKVKTVPGMDDRFDMVVEVPEASVGEESKVVVRVVPQAPWHMNLDYPTSLAINENASLNLGEGKLKKSDATRLDDEACQFDVAFTAAEAGEQILTGELRFAVCQDEACAPVTKPVEVKVAVK